LFRNATATLVTGKPAAELVMRAVPKHGVVTVFPYWVELPERIRALPTAEAKGPVRFVSVGRLEPVKRFDIAIEAVVKTINAVGVGRVSLSIIGDGSDRKPLERLALERRVVDAVTFVGWQEHDRAMDMIDRADALIHTADWEPYGVVVLEAMARGRTVLASDRTMAALDRITNGQSGCLFEHGNVEQLANIMKGIVEEPSRLISMGVRARQVAEEWPMSRAVSILRSIFEPVCVCS